MKILKIAFIVSLMAFTVGCNKKKKGGGGGVVAATSYYMNNGQCYNNLNQPVGMNFCQNIGGIPNGGGVGQMNNGQCYLNGQVVSMNYCQQTGYPNGGYPNGGFPGGGGGSTVQQCYGWYYVMSGYGYMEYYCSGFDCRGYTVYNLYNQPVYCQ